MEATEVKCVYELHGTPNKMAVAVFTERNAKYIPSVGEIIRFDDTHYYGDYRIVEKTSKASISYHQVSMWEIRFKADWVLQDD